VAVSRDTRVLSFLIPGKGSRDLPEAALNIPIIRVTSPVLGNILVHEQRFRGV